MGAGVDAYRTWLKGYKQQLAGRVSQAAELYAGALRQALPRLPVPRHVELGHVADHVRSHPATIEAHTVEAAVSMPSIVRFLEHGFAIVHGGARPGSKHKGAHGRISGYVAPTFICLKTLNANSAAMKKIIYG